MRLRRSCLTVPASNPRHLAKAASLAPDEVVIDLEDAVSPSAKTDETRELVAQSLRDGDWQATTIAVRVNAIGTPWYARDLEYVVERAGQRLDCVVLPKVEDPGHVQTLAADLAALERGSAVSRQIGIEALVETARGLVEVERIAASSDRLQALVFGPGDLAASLGISELSIGGQDGDYPGDRWHYARSRIAVAAGAFGLQAVDGPYGAVRDDDGFVRSARCSAQLGFDGKWVVHPDQIALANGVYTPSQDQFDRAHSLLAELANDAGVALYDGEMIDEASRRMADGVVARGHAAGLTTSTG
jgi:citrate lyase subunit beta / citryl-CoA lyase